MSEFSRGNIYQNLPATPQASELFELLASGAGSGVRIERIVSRGHVSPKQASSAQVAQAQVAQEADWYDQDEHEWVIVLQGEAVLAFTDRDDVRLGAGDYVCLPAHLRHRVAWTAPDTETIWLAVFFS